MLESGLDHGKDFNTQFAKREMIHAAGGTAEVVDLRPERLKDEVPLLFAPGWACTLPIYKPLLKTLTEEGRRVISLNHPRLGGKINLTAAEKELVKGFPVEGVRKALTLRDVMGHKKLEKVDVIAHSEGALNAAIAALLNPDKFRNIVFFAPPGLIGQDTPKRLLQGFLAQGNPKPSLDEIPVSEEDKAQAISEGSVAIEYPPITENPEAKEAIVGSGKIPVINKVLAKYVGANPVRGIREGWGMSQMQITDLIAKLRERGIGVIVITGVDDAVFPIEKMVGTQDKKTHELTPGTIRKGTLDGFLAVRGGHGQIGDNPERYAVAANQMLENLRDRKKRETSSNTI